MTFYEALSFIESAEFNCANIEVNGDIYERTNDWSVESREEFAAIIAGCVNRGDDVFQIMPCGEIEKISIKEFPLSPAIFEDEIALILKKFAPIGSTIYMRFAYGTNNKTLKVVKEIDYFSGDKYSKAVVYAIYEAIENDFLVFINGRDIYDLNKEIEY